MLRGIDELTGATGAADAELLLRVKEFTGIVNNRDFPCIFSTLPFSTAEIFFDLVGDADVPVEEAVVGSLVELCGIIQRVPDAVGVLFVTQPPEATLDDDFALASRIVRAVIDRNAADHPGETFPDPRDSDWELWLAGVGLFLNFSTPRHQRRRSRSVGASFTVIAQARATFDRHGRATPRARERIRNRLTTYDAVAPHPSLGSFHDADSREALQFFLGDGLEPMDPTEGCPHEHG